MKIEIDQSGKIEETSRDTILALSNGISYSIKISAKTKRKLQDLYRKIGEPRVFVINTFVVGLYLLIKRDISKITEIVIDIEYPGSEKLITNILKEIFSAQKVKRPPDIHFSLIGKGSKAHKAAVRVFRKENIADKVIEYRMMVRESLTTKNGRPVLKYPAIKAGKSAPLRPNLK